LSQDSSARIPVDVRRFPWVRRLAADYAYNFAALAPFYAGDPSAHASWSAAIARAQARSQPREDIARIIGAQQRRRGASARALEAGARLADPRTVAILTGQQAGLFGGPLYTLFKALTAVKLADQVSHTFGIPAVAVFWVDAEDHDWNEVRSCSVFDADLNVKTISLAPRSTDDQSPIATVSLDTSIVPALDELEQALPDTEFRAGLMAQLREAYAPGVGMADAFSRCLEQILGDRGLIVYDASDISSKLLAAPVFVRELSTPGDTVKLAGQAGADLTKKGYHAQVQTQDGSLALFTLGGGRRAVQRPDAAALVAQATQAPASFSPNVLLRPIVQDTLFPTISYVCGPSELAYLGQLRGVYEHFDVPMPLMYPRASATLVDSAALRFLSRYHVPFEALQAQDEAALNEVLKAQIPPAIEASLAEAQRVMDAAMADVITAMPALDPTLEGAARSTLGRMQHDLQTLNGKTIQAAKRRDDTLRRQFMRTRALAFPGGHAQERAVGGVSFLNQYGPALVDRLDDELPLDLGHHWIIAI
jgi:bacillithiol biosynthesis cysteine-adding enzyme BshC